MSVATAQTPPSRLDAWLDDLERRAVGPVLWLFTLVAAALRLPFLGTQSYWFDEIYTTRIVNGSGSVWHGVGATESTPPLYYELTSTWTDLANHFGEGATRAISGIALVLAVPVAYPALRRLVDWRAALAVAALLAVSPLLTWYALDARAYALFVLTGLISVGAFASVLDVASRERLVAWALAAAAAIWTHWFAGFLVLGELVALLWLRPAARRGTLLAAAGVAAMLLPLVGLLHEQTSDDRAAFIAQGSLVGRLEQLVRQFAAGPNVPRTWLEASALMLALGAIAVGTRLTVRRALTPVEQLPPLEEALRKDFGDLHPEEGARALLVVAAVTLLAPLALAATGVYDRFNVRNMIVLWPLAAALAAPALVRLRAIPLVMLLALGVATSLWTTTDWRYGNADWRGAIDRLFATPSVHQPVIAVTPLSAPVAEYYLGILPKRAAPLPTDEAWVVVEPARRPGSRALQPADPPLVGELLAAFPRHREQRFHAFRLIELRARRPVRLDPARLPGATLFAMPPR